MAEKIDRSKDFDRALALMEGEAPFVFVTGRAGTGKSTLLRHFRTNTKKRCAYLAPTGVAALNVEGETIHSFFRFPPGITVREAKQKGEVAEARMYKSLDSIIIDEVSMVRADVLDCIDAFLRAVLKDIRPFGGKRVIVIGDLYQLPPVVTSYEVEAFSKMYPTPYFFSSDVVDQLLEDRLVALVELEKVYRQRDQKFVALLNGVRNRSVTREQLEHINARVRPNAHEAASGTIRLTTTNAAAESVNATHLARLEAKAACYEGTVRGNFPAKDLPTEEKLTVKLGARVMCVANDSQGRYVNGTLGTVTKLGKELITVAIDGGKDVEVAMHTWNLFRTQYNKREQSLDQEKLGSFTQFPLRLAWAVTIHKSQGKTFEKVIIDLGRGAFAAGQVYVALSRCRTLDGIRLVTPVTTGQLLLDPRVGNFMATLQS